MHDSQTKLIFLLWGVIGVLVIGVAAGGVMMYGHAAGVDQRNAELRGDNESLQRQLKQIRSLPKPTPAPLPEATANQEAPTPTPAAAKKR